MPSGTITLSLNSRVTSPSLEIFPVFIASSIGLTFSFIYDFSIPWLYWIASSCIFSFFPMMTVFKVSRLNFLWKSLIKPTGATTLSAGRGLSSMTSFICTDPFFGSKTCSEIDFGGGCRGSSLTTFVSTSLVDLSKLPIVLPDFVYYAFC